MHFIHARGDLLVSCLWRQKATILDIGRGRDTILSPTKWPPQPPTTCSFPRIVHTCLQPHTAPRHTSTRPTNCMNPVVPSCKPTPILIACQAGCVCRVGKAGLFGRPGKCVGQAALPSLTEHGRGAEWVRWEGLVGHVHVGRMGFLSGAQLGHVHQVCEAGDLSGGEGG